MQKARIILEIPMALIQVRRGNEGIITIDEGLFNSIYGPAGFVRVSSGGAAPAQTQQPAPSPVPAASPSAPAQDRRPDTSGIPAGYVRITPEQARDQASFEDVRNVSGISGGAVDVILYAYPIPKATLVNQQGQRVVVRTDGRYNPQNSIPTSQQMFDQGYRLERAPGVPAEPFTTQRSQTQDQVQTQGTVDQRSNPSILLPDGRLIRPDNPQYSQLRTVPGSIQIDEGNRRVVPGTNGAIQTFADGSQLNTETGQIVRGAIDFSRVQGLGAASAPASGSPSGTGAGTQGGEAVRLGPSQFQALVGQGLTEGDIERRGTDIYLRPTSRFYAQVSGTSPSGPSSSDYGSGSGTGTGGAMGGSGGSPAGSVAVDPADRTWVNQLYQRFFDRDATSSELSNWARETPQALEQFLRGEARRYGYTSAYFRDDSNQRLQQAIDYINSQDLPPDVKALWIQTIRAYPPGAEYNNTEVLNAFNQVKRDTIDPQFRELANIAITDFQRNVEAQRASYEIQTEQNRATAGQNIRQAKDALEKSGMTFTGSAIEQLGADSAFAQPGTAAASTSAIPNQDPFGGLFYEGQVNQQNRLMASSSALQNRNAIRQSNRALELAVGSTAAAGAGATDLQGGVTGTLETQRQGQYAQSLSQIMQNYRQRQQLNTNTQV